MGAGAEDDCGPRGRKRRRRRLGAGRERVQHRPRLLQPARRRLHGRDRGPARRLHPEPEGCMDPRPGRERECEQQVGDVHHQAERQLVLGRQEAPGHLQGLRLHAAEARRPEQHRRESYRLQQPRPDEVHAQGRQAGHAVLEDDQLHTRLSVRSVRELAVPVLDGVLPIAGAGRSGLQQDLDKLRLRQRRQARHRRPVLRLELHGGPGRDAEGEPVLLPEGEAR